MRRSSRREAPWWKARRGGRAPRWAMRKRLQELRVARNLRQPVMLTSTPSVSGSSFRGAFFFLLFLPFLPAGRGVRGEEGGGVLGGWGAGSGDAGMVEELEGMVGKGGRQGTRGAR